MHAPPGLFAAPHRSLFLAGASQAVLAMAWWSHQLGARLLGKEGALLGALAPVWVHGALLIFGVFPFFIFGFVLTAGPRWQGYGEIKAQVTGPATVSMAGGWLIFYGGLVHASLQAPGLALVLAAWLILLRETWRVALHPAQQTLHIRILAAALSVGALGVALLLVCCSGGPTHLAQGALGLGLWAFLLPVYGVVGHRMIPFFSAAALPGYRVVQPTWALLAVCGGGLLHGLIVVGGASGVIGAISTNSLVQWAWLADLPGLVAAVYLSRAWQLRRALSVPMLAMLHVGFAWLGLGLGLSVLQGLLELAGLQLLGLAPLHALTVGFFASILLAMASRVSLGHSGRPMRADQLTWLIFQGIQLSALIRVSAEVLPFGAPYGQLGAALIWLLVFGAWWGKYAPMLWQPRADGRPG